MKLDSSKLKIEEILVTRMCKHMSWTECRGKIWYRTKNPFFRNLSPREMVLKNRSHKVLEFIKSREESE